MPSEFFGLSPTQIDEIEHLRAENAELRHQNQRLSEEVKQLIKTESRLYQFQEKLDRQVQIYQTLYELGKAFNQTFDLDTALTLVTQCLIHDFNFERCLIWLPQVSPVRAHAPSATFTVCAFEGYYEDDQVEHLKALKLVDDSLLFQSLTEQDVCVYNTTVEEPQLAQWCADINMDEYIVLPLKTDSQAPLGLLVVGNTATMWQYQNRVTTDQNEILGLANLASQVVAAINSVHFYQALQGQQTLLEKKVRERTQELNTRNKSLATTLQTLQQTQAQLIQSEKMSSLGQLVAGVAHEINNPVNFIDGNLQYLQEHIAGLFELVELYRTNTSSPNTTICKLLDKMDIEFLEEDLPKSMASMQTGMNRIKEIVHSLRTFSRMDQAEKKFVDIHEGIDSTLMILAHRLKVQSERPAIQVVKHYGDLHPVECYAGQLNQVLMNLLSNAIDACEEIPLQSDMPARHHSDRNDREPDDSEWSDRNDRESDDSEWSDRNDRESDDSEWSDRNDASHSSSRLLSSSLVIDQLPEPIRPPTITISTEIADENLVIRIADNGPGMSEQIQAKMFNPFFTTKAIGKGTGMGLSISYQIITERHGGTLTCESVVDQGTIFTICIPL